MAQMSQVSDHSANVACTSLISLAHDTENTVFFYILSEGRFEVCVERAHTK